jgi:hypothetical protein
MTYFPLRGLYHNLSARGSVVICLARRGLIYISSRVSRQTIHLDCFSFVKNLTLSEWKLSWLRRFPVCSSLDFRVFFELFSSVFRACLVPSLLRCLGSDLLVRIMDSCLVHLCA